MPPGNTLVGDFGLPLYESDSPTEAHPFPVSGTHSGGLTIPSAADSNMIANYVAFLVIFALAVLILIRIAGLQGMIAVGRA